MDDERSGQIGSVIWKGVAVLAGLAVVIALGTFVMVQALGLDDGGSEGAVSDAPAAVAPLPTTALPDPDASSTPDDEESEDPDDTATASPSADADAGAGARGLRLTITPAVAAPMERLNLTGSYRGHDNESLQVQRLENGTWADFPTQAHVSMGTFETYVMTSQPGDNRFRVYDPRTDKASNVVTITIH